MGFVCCKLRFYVFWDVTLRFWINSSRRCGGTFLEFLLKGFESHVEMSSVLGECDTSFETWVSTDPPTHHDIPEDRNSHTAVKISKLVEIFILFLFI
jgi:hypothetical protein